jgi:hypothetical protein
MDLIVKLPKSGSYDSILVVVDQGLSKGVIFIPCNETIDALETSNLLFQNVYKRFGLYDAVISDRGPQFASQVTKELYKLLGIERKMSTAYHPQTDGQTERVNQELETYLRIFTQNQQDNWHQHLHMAEFAHNIREHSAKKMSPFFIMMGYNPKEFPTITTKPKTPALEQRMKLILQIRDEAMAAHENARRTMKERYKGKWTPFKIGDKVWLDNSNLKLQHGVRKLNPKREGPMRILKIMGKHAYKIQLPAKWKNVHPVFHASKLLSYKETTEHGKNFTQPPPDIIDEEQEWEIGEIINHRQGRYGKEFLVTWKGFSSSENTWLTEKDFKHAKTILSQYKKRKKLQ